MARIWRRDAPSVRSIPNSRVRWATVIENVLKIWKAPTNSDTPANTSSAIRRKLRLLLDVARLALGRLVAGLDQHLVGHDLRDPVAQLLGRHAVGRGHGDLVELALAVGDPLRLGQQHLGDAGAAEARVAQLREARRCRYVFASCAPASRSLPPIFRWPVSAVCVSIETSESDRGLRPST